MGEEDDCGKRAPRRGVNLTREEVVDRILNEQARAGQSSDPFLRPRCIHLADGEFREVGIEAFVSPPPGDRFNLIAEGLARLWSQPPREMSRSERYWRLRCMGLFEAEARKTLRLSRAEMSRIRREEAESKSKMEIVKRKFQEAARREQDNSFQARPPQKSGLEASKTSRVGVKLKK